MSDSPGSVRSKIAALPLDLVGPVRGRADAFGDVLPVSSLKGRALLLHALTLSSLRLPSGTGALFTKSDRLWLSVAVGDDDVALGRVVRRALGFAYSADSCGLEFPLSRALPCLRHLLVTHRVDKTLELRVVGFPFVGLGLPGVVHVDELLLDLALGDLLARFAALRRGSTNDDGEPHGFTVRVIGVLFLPVVHSAHLLPCCFHALVDVVDQRIVLVRAAFPCGVLGFAPELLIPLGFDDVARHQESS